MSSRDPRIIAEALEDLREETRLWSTAAAQTLAAAYQTQRHVRESMDRGFHRASVVLDEAQQDHERVANALSSIEAQVDQAEAAKGDAQATLERAQEAVQEATAVLEFWEGELQKALAWLARAEARLERAIAEYQRAQSAFEQAKWALERAESRYNSCLRDKNRSNCNSEARDVNSAAEALQNAAYQLQVAEAEVIAARAEVAAARARVQCCSQAVEYATEAVRVAREAESSGEQAVNTAERSTELARAAQEHGRLAEAKVRIELETAEQMLSAAKEAVSQSEEAGVQLTTADKAEEAAQRYALGARHEIEHSLSLLREIDVPDLEVSAAGHGSSGTGIAAAPSFDARRATSAIARKIASGHALVKHRKHFPDWDVNKLSKKIEETMNGPNVKQLLRGGTAYWNEEEQMIVFHDLKNRDGGTAFRPDKGRKHFDNLRERTEEP